MTKAEKETQARLVDVLEANSRVLEKVFDVLTLIANPQISQPSVKVEEIVPGEIVLGPEMTASEVKEREDELYSTKDNKTEVTPDIDIEYCRKALHAIGTKIPNAEVKEFLASFGGAKTIPQLDKKYYSEFISKATAIMEANV